MSEMNHWERIEAALAGQATDRAPVALWRHFPNDDLDPAKLAAHSVQWQRRWDCDLVKFMPSGMYGVEDWGTVTEYRGTANGARESVRPAITSVEGWRNLERLDVRQGSYGRQNQALAMTARELAGSVPILQTIFSPLTTARKMSSERLFADLRRAPEAVEHALQVITDMTIEFALQALQDGAHGVFFATQLASYRLLTAAEYDRFGRHFDLQILDALKGKARLNMLHIHGDDIMFDHLSDYPVQMLNWHDRLTEPNLRQAAQRFKGLLVGGISEHGTLVNGTLAEIEAEVHDALAQTQGRRLVIGPGCVLPVRVTDDRLEAVRRAARTFAAKSG